MQFCRKIINTPPLRRFFGPHTVILEYFNTKALSNFAFQSFSIFIGTQDKNNFSIPVRDPLGPTYQGMAISTHSEKPVDEI